MKGGIGFEIWRLPSLETKLRCSFLLLETRNLRWYVAGFNLTLYAI